jgi:AsmA family
VKLRSKRGLIIVCAALVLGLFLIRPGATRLKARIANSIVMALQRQVEISRVHVRLLPQPGFDLEGFVVHDDPAFSAEPVLRAQEVTAFLRLSSLLRGRLEISRLSLTEPSLNLVRRDDGHWNIENLLERTAQIAVAPTSKARSELRPAFPYIEADRGRINFKFGPEKKPFAVTDAKYAFWQDSENAWGMRLKGQPVRTDFNLSDTGQLRASGTWQRALTLHETPVQFSVQWDGAQLGQLTKLLSGEDRGWRGTVGVSLGFAGTPADLTVRGESSLQDFHRYDIADTGTLELKSHCEAHYNGADHSLNQILCQTPVGDGSLSLNGEVTNLLGPRRYDLQMVAEKVPIEALLAVVRRAKKDLPDDLRATGTVGAKFSARASGQTPNTVEFGGGGQTSEFLLQSDATKTVVPLEVVPFSLGSGSQGKVRNDPARRDTVSMRELVEPHLSVGPFALKLGRPSPVSVQGWIARSGYSMSAKGDADLQHLLEVARVAGVPAAHPAANGSAKLDLQIAGTWAGFASPLTTGTAELHSVRAAVRGLNGPVEIASAKVSLGELETKVEAISASVAGTQWTGSLSLPRRCPVAQACPFGFDLHADEISTEQLNEWLNPNPPKRPWYRFSAAAPQSGQSFLARIRATGTLTANRIVIRDLVATRVAASVDLAQGKLRMSDLRGEVWGGKHRGEWRADFTVKPPKYSGNGVLDGITLAQLAEAMHDNWITGTAYAKYQIELAGFSSAELVSSAKGDLHFDMRDGALPHLTLTTVPLRVRRFTGLLAVHQGDVDLQQAILESPTASYAVTGKASMSRKLDFKLVQEGSPGLMVTGSLSDPRVAPVHRPETQAALKR